MTKTATKASETPSTGSADLILFGLDDSGKPRAARFGGSELELATKAAGLMSLSICHAGSAELAEIARKLPDGRIHANGRGFVPNVRQDLYAKLVELAATKTGDTAQADQKLAEAGTGNQVARTENQPPQAAPAHAYPRDWDDISIGHLVIANEGADLGWWEAVVIAREGDMLTMRWRDYPKQPKFIQHRSVVALLNPGTP